MNKKLLFAATVAAMLASCSSDSLSVQTAARQDAQGLENAVSFEALSQRSLTRAGYAGVMDNDQLKTNGFGVFGYYTDLNEYDQTSTPNFMYNQKVSGAGWTYEPVKYWPNEYGNTAVSDDVDKLTFFAYAPYTANTPASGKVAEDQVGITGFTRNSTAGDPYVKYIASLDPSKCVDLCWGVANPSADVTWDIIQGGSQTIDKGMPWMNVQRPQKSLGQKMKLYFKHALSQLNVQIDADVNTDTHDAGAEVDSKSKVFVRSITFNGFAMKGALNLNNEEAGVPNWKGYGCNCEPLPTEEYTIYDGMKDGKEGTGYTASNEKVTGLNPTIIQDKAWNQSAEGVTKTAKNLFNNTGDNPQATDPIYVIPTGDDLSVTIVYDIETEDEKLAGTVSDNETHGVSFENKISKTIKITGDGATADQNLKLEAGKKYTIQLHLGLSQVEFDAEVSPWVENEGGEAWLPGNGAGDVYTTDISLDQTTLNMTVGDDDVTLNPTVTPANATDQTVSWTSSDDAVATVDANGKVHAVAAGTATITATASGGQTATCDVTVSATACSGSPLSSATLGQIVCEHGKVHNATTGELACGGEKVAVVVMSGYAIALQDSPWQSWNEITSDGANKNVDCVLADDKRGDLPAAPAGTVWKILNKANYISIYEATGATWDDGEGLAYDIGDNHSVNNYIAAAGGEIMGGTYWSTQESTADCGWASHHMGWIGVFDKSTFITKVRPVLVW